VLRPWRLGVGVSGSEELSGVVYYLRERLDESPLRAALEHQGAAHGSGESDAEPEHETPAELAQFDASAQEKQEHEEADSTEDAHR
jgi:hypothetical protein